MPNNNHNSSGYDQFEHNSGAYNNLINHELGSDNNDDHTLQHNHSDKFDDLCWGYYDVFCSGYNFGCSHHNAG